MEKQIAENKEILKDLLKEDKKYLTEWLYSALTGSEQEVIKILAISNSALNIRQIRNTLIFSTIFFMLDRAGVEINKKWDNLKLEICGDYFYDFPRKVANISQIKAFIEEYKNKEKEIQKYKKKKYNLILEFPEYERAEILSSLLAEVGIKIFGTKTIKDILERLKGIIQKRIISIDKNIISYFINPKLKYRLREIFKKERQGIE
jgi:hypothetical protein